MQTYEEGTGSIMSIIYAAGGLCRRGDCQFGSMMENDLCSTVDLEEDGKNGDGHVQHLNMALGVSCVSCGES